MTPGKEIEKKRDESVVLTNPVIDPNKFKLGKPPKSKHKKPSFTHSTHTGITLSVMEEAFITEYIKNGGDKDRAYIDSGGSAKNVSSASARMLRKPYIQEEISYRMDLAASRGVADANEIMQYFSSVMRGEVLDQFDMPASLQDRTNAAKELAKRQIDAVEKAKLSNNKNIDMTIVLDWERPEPSNIIKAEENINTEEDDNNE